MAKETDVLTGQPIGTWQQRVGLSHTPSYQSAGTPYLTGSFIRAEINSGSIKRFEFPRVAKSVTVQLVPPSYIGYGANQTEVDPIFVFFGNATDAGGNSRLGKDTFKGVNDGDATSAPFAGAPNALTQNHSFLLKNTTGSQGPSGKHTFGVRTDHVNIMVVAGHGLAVTGAFQIHAELTNIPAARMPANYLSGSGVNDY